MFSSKYSFPESLVIRIGGSDSTIVRFPDLLAPTVGLGTWRPIKQQSTLNHCKRPCHYVSFISTAGALVVITVSGVSPIHHPSIHHPVHILLRSLSTVIARCYLHLRWYFCLLLSTIRGVDFDHMFLREEISFLSTPVPTLNVDCYLVVANNSTFAPRSSAVSKQMIKDIIHNQHICWWKHYQRYNRP